MSDLLEQIQAKIDAAKAARASDSVALVTRVPLPPEAQAHYEALQALHPGAVIEIERRIFMRVYDSDTFICIDVRNYPDQ